MNYKLILKKVGIVAGSVGLGAAVDAAEAAIGCAIMNKSNNPDYITSDAAKAATVGGAITGAGIGLFYCWRSKGPSTRTLTEELSVRILMLGISIGSGALGKIILDSAVDLSVEQVVIAMAIGGAIINGGAFALKGLVSCCEAKSSSGNSRNNRC